MTDASSARPAQNNKELRAKFAELFTPKLVTVLREGYAWANFRADAMAGLTVAIVALPLSMAIAIASGATPAQGLYTAIIGGFLVSALGGSRFQIGGPAGAFIVLVAATVQQFGMDGLILATIMAGFMLAAAGFLQWGAYVKFIPYPVTVGFTAGIAVIIFASQIKELLGLDLGGPEPGPLVEKLQALWMHIGTADAPTIALSAGTIVLIASMRKFLPRWPGMLIAVGASSIIALVLHLPVDTIGSLFGGIPSGLPAPSIPEISAARLIELLPSAFAFALLGAIESLLSAVVADGMSGRRHRSNCELVAQGAANIASGLFGGICVTGTIARTATNVRAGAHGPIAGMLHAGFLLVFILAAAPLASFIPLASLAGVLAFVAWNMVERHAFVALLRVSRGDALVLSTTFLLTIFRDLTEAIIAGFAMGAVLFIHRLSKTIEIEEHAPFIEPDKADSANGGLAPYNEALNAGGKVLTYRISGAFFFGAAAAVSTVMDRISGTFDTLIIDFSAVPLLDSTGANVIEGLVRKMHARSIRVYIAGARADVRKPLQALGVKAPRAEYIETVQAAIERRRAE